MHKIKFVKMLYNPLEVFTIVLNLDLTAWIGR